MAVELTNCDKEQIQFIERIQPFGALFVLNSESVIISCAASSEFELDPKAVLGKTIEDILQSDAELVFKMLGDRSDSTRPILLRSKTWKRWMTAIAHNNGDLKVIELEFLPIKEVEIPSVNFIRERREPLYAYLRFIADNLREVTGYERVMVYRFAADWHGEVVAESVSPGVHSFLGHHFPASDIPVPARELFLKNWVRAIFDVNSEPIDIEQESDRKVDLSKSVLRAPSEIHIEYLKNMQVGASLTLSLMQDGELWGLIACHHSAPKYMTAEERAVCALIAKLVSARITSFATADSMAAIQRVSSFTSDLTKDLSPGRMLDAIRTRKADLMTFVSCDGFCSAQGSDYIREGETPSAEKLKILFDFLNQQKQEIVATDSAGLLSQELSTLAPECVGFMAIRLDDSWLVWFRKEFTNSRLWAGNPSKAVHMDNGIARVSPRLSFEAWTEQMRGSSKIWERSEFNAAQMLRIEILRTLDGTRKVAPFSLDEYENLLDLLTLEPKTNQ